MLGSKHGRLEKVAELDGLDVGGKYDPDGFITSIFKYCLMEIYSSSTNLDLSGSRGETTLFGSRPTTSFLEALSVSNRLRYGFRVRRKTLVSSRGWTPLPAP